MFRSVPRDYLPRNFGFLFQSTLKNYAGKEYEKKKFQILYASPEIAVNLFSFEIRTDEFSKLVLGDGNTWINNNNEEFSDVLRSNRKKFNQQSIFRYHEFHEVVFIDSFHKKMYRDVFLYRLLQQFFFFCQRKLWFCFLLSTDRPII